jgi:YVTN family beta-propeller protein
MPRITIVVLSLLLAGAIFTQSTQGQADAGLLRLVTVIPMPGVEGRIDHMAIDLAGRRLFVAALGNNSVEVIDLKSKARVHTIRGLAEPQGIAFIASRDRLFVANAKDGSVRSFDAQSWAPLNSIDYGDDADNLRIAPDSGHLWVGYGSGALAEFDADGTKIGEIKVNAHPESFQLEKNGDRTFVNLPDARRVGVVDRKKRSILASWSTGGAQANFPMALDEGNHRLFVVTRKPPKLVVLNTENGKEIASIPAIGDCDDVFYDSDRRRIYAIGGEGGISVFEQSDPDNYRELGRVLTVPGARTGFFAPKLSRLYLGVRKHDAKDAEIRVYSTAP